MRTGGQDRRPVDQRGRPPALPTRCIMRHADKKTSPSGCFARLSSPRTGWHCLGAVKEQVPVLAEPLPVGAE
jgi:hypothetical protein